MIQMDLDDLESKRMRMLYLGCNGYAMNGYDLRYKRDATLDLQSRRMGMLR